MFTKSSVVLAGALVLASVSAALAEPPDVPNYYDTLRDRQLYPGNPVYRSRAPLSEGRNVAVPPAPRGQTVEEELLFKRAQGR